MENVTIGVVGTVVGATLGVISALNYSKKETKEEGEKDGEIKGQLNYISKGVDDIRLDIRVQDRKISDITERVVRVEESTKSAHKRLDGIEREE